MDLKKRLHLLRQKEVISKTLCSSSFSRFFNLEISAECRSMLCFKTQWHTIQNSIKYGIAAIYLYCRQNCMRRKICHILMIRN